MRAGLISYYRTDKEKLYNFLLVSLSLVFWLSLLYYLVYADEKEIISFLPILAYLLLFIFILLVSAFVFRAKAFGNMVHINSEQFPDLYNSIVQASHRLGMDVPDAFVMNSGGLINAFAYRAFRHNYVILTSSLIDANNDEQIKFVIGHELGHLAAGHLNLYMAILRLPARIIPGLHSAYSRQREYTCDAIGLHLSRNLAEASTALQMLGCGCQRLNPKLNLKAFIKQESSVPAFSGFIYEFLASHPRLTKRVIALSKLNLTDDL